MTAGADTAVETIDVKVADGSADRALALAEQSHARSIRALADIVRVRSLTGEEGTAQKYLATVLEGIGAEVTIAEPDIADLFRRFPKIAQYPTHWQNDLILPYDVLPTHEALVQSGLDEVLTYRDRPNVVAVMRGTGGGRSIILNSHVDTVAIGPIGDWTRDPFGGVIENGLMYGRGTSDMKGGMMAAIMALTYLNEAGVRLRGDVMFQSVVNEEHSGNGTLDLVRRGYTADAAIVLEPTHNKVSVSHPGGLYWQLNVPGISRSPGARWEGEHQAGVSAIEKLPNVIAALVALEREFNTRLGADSNGKTRKPFSLVFGRVAGGHYETVTASEATLRGVVYFAPSVGDIGDVMDRLRAAIEKCNKADPFLSEHPAKIAFLHHDDSTRQSPDMPIAVQSTKLLARRGGDGSIVDGPFCCDMRHLVNQGGIPSIIFGPGTIAQAHKPDEHISLSEYTACIEHLIAFIAEWCNSATV